MLQRLILFIGKYVATCTSFLLPLLCTKKTAQALIRFKESLKFCCCLTEWCSLLEHHILPYERKPYWGCYMEKALHPVESLRMFEFILCLTYGLA